MIKFLLDTDTCIFCLRNQYGIAGKVNGRCDWKIGCKPLNNRAALVGLRKNDQKPEWNAAQ